MRSDSIKFAAIAGRNFQNARLFMRNARKCSHADLKAQMIETAKFSNRLGVTYLQLARNAQRHEHIRITAEVENAI